MFIWVLPLPLPFTVHYRKNLPHWDPALWISLLVMITKRIFYFLFGHRTPGLPVTILIITLPFWHRHPLLSLLVYPLFSLVASPCTLPTPSHLTPLLQSPSPFSSICSKAGGLQFRNIVENLSHQCTSDPFTFPTGSPPSATHRL